MSSLCCCLGKTQSQTPEPTVETPLLSRKEAVITNQPKASKEKTANQVHLTKLKALIRDYSGTHIVFIGGEDGVTRFPSYSVFKHEALAYSQENRFKVVTKVLPRSDTKTGFNGALSIKLDEDDQLEMHSQINLFTDYGSNQRTCSEQKTSSLASFKQNPSKMGEFDYSITLDPPAYLFKAPQSLAIHKIIWLHPSSAEFIDIEL